MSFPGATDHKNSGARDEDRYRNPDSDPRGPYLLTNMTNHGTRPSRQYSWRGHLPPDGRSWRFTIERAEAAHSENRIIWSDKRLPRLKRYLSETAGDQQPEPDLQTTTATRVDRAVRSLMKVLAIEIVSDPDYLMVVEWRDLERLLGEVFSVLGFDVIVTRPGRDGGFDLELRVSATSELYLLEVKHWKAPSRPSPRILENFLEIVMRRRVSGGLLLSSSGYSAPALMDVRKSPAKKSASETRTRSSVSVNRMSAASPEFGFRRNPCLRFCSPTHIDVPRQA